jgi:hypothetical protein
VYSICQTPNGNFVVLESTAEFGTYRLIRMVKSHLQAVQHIRLIDPTSSIVYVSLESESMPLDPLELVYD